MKKIPVTLFIVSALLFILPEKTEAQSLKDILKSETAQKVIDAVRKRQHSNSKTCRGPGNTKEQPANLKVRNYSKRQEV